MWITSMGNHGAVSQNAGVLVVLVLPPLISNQLKNFLILNWSAKMQYWYLCTSIIISIASSVDLLHLFEITFGYIQVQFVIATHTYTHHTLHSCVQWQAISSTLSCDFRPLTMISNDLRVISDVFVKLSQGKNIVEEIELIMGTHGEQTSPLVSLYSTEIPRDFWNTLTRHREIHQSSGLNRWNSGRPMKTLIVPVFLSGKKIAAGSPSIQFGTKPNLVAKILATNFGVFFVIYVMFSKICSMWN